MSTADIDVPTVRRAIATFLRLAWPGAEDRKSPPIPWERIRGLEDLTPYFELDSGESRLRRLVLRLGNHRYPHMKLVIQDFLIPGQWSFGVDAHDDHFQVSPQVPDYEGWLAVKRSNADLRAAIEDAWVAEGIPTLATVVARLEKETPPGAAAGSDDEPLILIVDDEARWARAAQVLMRREGYRTVVFHSPEAASHYLETNQPDLILSDFEMGAMTGLDLAASVRERPGGVHIPFILLSAGRNCPRNHPNIDGFLAKPYDRADLARVVRERLSARQRKPDAPSPAESP